MHIKYRWRAKPGFADTVTLPAQHVPRIDERVVIRVDITADETLEKIGKVNGVNYTHDEDGQHVEVLLS